MGDGVVFRVDFSEYWEICDANECTHFITTKLSGSELVTVLLGLYGGLASVLGLSAFWVSRSLRWKFESVDFRWCYPSPLSNSHVSQEYNVCVSTLKHVKERFEGPRGRSRFKNLIQQAASFDFTDDDLSRLQAEHEDSSAHTDSHDDLV